MARLHTPIPTPASADGAALDALLDEQQRAEVEQRAAALVARNAMLALVDQQREASQLTKKELARRAGLDPSALRRMLTAETANPTSENVFRLLKALDIHLEAVTPSGGRVALL